MHIKYIDNNIQYGINYDFDVIRKEFNALGIPKNVFNPMATHRITSGRYIMDLSERSTGKTTNWLLLGMVMNKLYGTQIIYVRQIVDMIMPKHTSQLFSTIIEHGYIQKLTDGRYDSVKYASRKFYYYSSETFEVSEEAFMCCLSIDENAKNKSSFNAPRGDLIIYDEFISRYTYQNEFVDFMDTVKTVVRERDAAIIVLIANTIDKNHIYFRELGVQELVQSLEVNSRKELENPEGSIVDVALIGTSVELMPKHRKEHNRKFFGFKNPLLNSIRGGDWAVKMYPHIPKLEVRLICRNRYISFNGHLINLELVHSSELGLFCRCHLATRTYDDSIIYCMDTELTTKNEVYGWGSGKIDILLKELLIGNKWYYASNMEGNLVESYVREFKHDDRF